MSKTLRTAAIVVGAVALAATGVGAAVSAGVLAASATTATIATIASVSQVVSAVALTASSATAGRPVTLGNATKFKIDKEAGVPIAIGRTFVGGNVVHRQYYDDPGSRMKNQRESWVTVYSLGPVKALGPLLVDRVAVSFNGSGAAVGVYSGNMWLDSQRGFSPEARALQAPTGYFPGWNASSKLSGLAADLWTLDFDSKGKKFPNGIPQRGRVVEGVYCWDPRQDSTYPGGLGPCRADDPSTHIYTECPWLHGLQHALGRVQNGQLIAGGGVKVSGVLVSTFVEAANVSDANGWKAGGVVYATTDNDWDILKMLAQAGGGEVFPIAGKLACSVAAPKVSIGTITSADIVGDIIAPSTASKRARRNTIIARIRLESHGWEMVPLTAVKVDEYIALDGAPRPREITYALVQHAKQAAELATYELMNAREIDGIILPCNFAHLAYLPGDCVTLQIPEANLVDREVVLRTRDLDPGNLGVTFSARTETAGKHPYALGKTTTPPPTPDLSVPSLDLDAPEGWSAMSGTIDSEGIPLPALIVQGEVDNAAAEAVVFEYRPIGATEWWSAGNEAVNAVRKTIMQVAADTVYEVSVQYRVRGALTDRQLLEPVAIGRTYVSWRDGVEGDGKPDDNADVTGDNVALDVLNIGGRPVGDVLGDIADISDAAEAIAGLADDGVLTVDEKIRDLAPNNQRLNAIYGLLITQSEGVAHAAVATARANLITARNAWDSFLGEIGPKFWYDVTGPSDIDRATYRARLLSYETTLNALTQAMRDWARAVGQAAQDRVDRIAADGWLTAGQEKAEVQQDYNALVDRLNRLVERHDALGQPADALDERSAAGNAVYNGRPSSLGTYLNSLNPPFTDGATDTAINPVTYRNRWQVALAAVAAFEAALLGTIPQSVQSSLDALLPLNSDGVWTPYEKRSVLFRENASLEATWSLLDSKAAAIGGSAALTTARTNASTARSSWQNFLAAVPTWSDPNVSTTVNTGEARTRLVNYGAMLDALAEALRVYTDTRVTTIADRVAAIDSDGIISRGEKWYYVKEWQALVNKYQRAVDRYIALGYPSSVFQAQQDAYAIIGPDGSAPSTSLGKVLGALSPQWDNADFDTPLAPVTTPQALQNLWVNADNAADRLVAAMMAQPNADNTQAQINAGAADTKISTTVNTVTQPLQQKTQLLDTNGRATSRRANTQFALGGAQQIYLVGGVAANPLSAAPQGNGYHVAITIAAHSVKDDAGTINYGSGSVSFMEPNTNIYIFEDDPTYAGGARFYQWTTNPAVLADAPGRRYVGLVFTGSGAAGTPPSTGGGGGGGGIRTDPNYQIP
ncbi:hypothetical protein [Sphingomonas sp. AX6]|uniref:hypothetical protein n=1 Tax=Sphingomonas sp. AX6 TaxID=2653171 RepID=UPI0012EEF5C5|nr:hypothetical protein [Sphingomonas sp. AX6]VXC63708.1 exported hypothetical protein [Sphingomonas sp. AX6]